MAQSEKPSSRPELLFLDHDIDELKGPSLPTNGDVLRYYYNRRHALPEKTSGEIVRLVVSECLEIWSANGIPAAHRSHGVKSLKKMVREFNGMKGAREVTSEPRRRYTLAVWRRRYELMFYVASGDALEKSSAENREMLLAAKRKIKEFEEAVKNDTLGVEEENNNSAEREESREKKAQLDLKNSVEIASVVGSKGASSENSPKALGNVRISSVRINGKVVEPKASKRLKKTAERTNRPSVKDAGINNKNNSKENVNPVSKTNTVNATPKAFKRLNDEQTTYDSPNQDLREKMKQQGWVYIKKNPTWKLAIVEPPKKLPDD